MQRFVCAGTGVFTFVVATGTLVATFAFLLEMIAADQVGAWDFVAIGTGLVFAAAFFWVAWKCRLGALPFRFVADAARRECGYRWRSWWALRIDLSDAARLTGRLSYTSVRPYEGSWRWSIYASKKGYDADVELYCSLKAYDLEEDAEADCQQTLQALSEYLGLPSEYIGNSEPTLLQQ